MNAPVRHATLRQFVYAVLDYQLNGRVDPKLAAASGVGEFSGSGGGFLIPPDIAATLWTKAYSTGRILGMCTPQPVSRSKGVRIPAISETSRADGSRFGGVRSYFVDEGGAGTASKPKFDSIEFALRKLLTIIYATDEIQEDVPALSAFIERVMGMELQFTIEDKIINGSGSGVPLGVLNSDVLIKVAAEGGQQAGTVVFENLQNMASRLWGPSHANGVWLMNNDVYKQILGIENTDGQTLFELGPDGRRYLMQMPVELCEYTSTLGSIGDIILGDFSQYLISDQESTIEQSIHVQFDKAETAFKMRSRVEGQPAWKSPVTPKNSTTTQSPFVALAARP